MEVEEGGPSQHHHHHHHGRNRDDENPPFGPSLSSSSSTHPTDTASIMRAAEAPSPSSSIYPPSGDGHQKQPLKVTTQSDEHSFPPATHLDQDLSRHLPTFTHPQDWQDSWEDTDTDNDPDAISEVETIRTSNGHLSDSESIAGERVCRICRCGPEPGQPLFHPCKCAGSIRYCHQDCLKEWLLHSRKSQCELCHHTFAFHKVYSSSMPAVVPLHLQAKFLLKRMFSWLLFALRAVVVVTVWLVFLPWANIHFFRGAFWISDALLWVGGAGTSSWSKIVTEEMTRSLASAPPTASSSARAAPSPLPSHLSIGSYKAGISATTDAGNGPLRSLWSLLISLNDGVLFTALVNPIKGIRMIVSTMEALHDEIASWDWKTPAGWICQAVFQGQVLTCTIVLIVVAAWFTREWVIMNLPAQPAPAPVLREDPMEENPVQVELDGQERFLEEIPEPWTQREQRAWEELYSLRGTQILEGAQEQEREEGDLFRPIQGAHTLFQVGNQHGDSSDATVADLQPLKREGWSEYSNSRGSLAGQGQTGESSRTSQNGLIDGPWSPDAGKTPSAPLEIFSAEKESSEQTSMVSSATTPHIEDGPRTAEQLITDREGKLAEDLSVSGSSSSKAVTSPEASSRSFQGRAFPAQNTVVDEHDGQNMPTQTPEPLAPVTATAEAESSCTSTTSSTSQALTEDIEDDGNDDGWDSEGNQSSSSSSSEEDDPPRDQHRRRAQLERNRLRREEREGAPPPPELPVQPVLIPVLDQGQARQALAEALERRLDPGAADLEALDAAAAAAAAEAQADWEEVQWELQGVIDAIGFRGDPWNVAANFSIVVSLCSFFIILSVGLPYFVGRLFGLGAGLVEFVSAPIRLIRLVTDPCFDWMIEIGWRMLSKMGWQWNPSAEAAESSFEAWVNPDFLHKVVDFLNTSDPAPPTTHKLFTSSFYSFLTQANRFPSFVSTALLHPIEGRLVTRALTTSNQVLCVFVGHIWLMAGIATHILIGERNKKKKQSGATGAEDVSEESWVKEVVIQVLTVFKVLAFLCIEIIVFPIGCGVALDICTLPLFAGTVASRWDRLLTRPITHTFQLWFVGTLFMFRLGCLISHIRKTLRPGVLSWIRDPEDPDFQPIKEILERKTTTHLSKIGASAMMYGGLIMTLFGVTCWSFGWLVRGTSLLPLRLTGQPPAIPLDLLCMVFVLPLLAKNLKPLKRAASISKRWWRFSTYHLGVTEYFFDSKLPTGTVPPVSSESTFYARVPDSDNSVVGSPLMIHVDKHGEAISERGKEALRKQRKKIAEMKEPKAKYKVLLLPIGFGKRVRLLLALLWASLAVGALITVFVPLVVGRRLLGDQDDYHDVYAFARGIVALSPLYPVAHLLVRTKTVQWKLDRPSWGGEDKLRGNRKARRELRKSTWWLRPSTPLVRKRLRLKLQRLGWRGVKAALSLLAFGLTMPTVLGLTIDQLVVAQLRFSRREVARTSLPYAWAMGLLEQEVFYRVVVQLLRPDWFPALKDTYRRGFRRPRLLFSLRRVFLPVVGYCLFLLLSPLVLAAAVERVIPFFRSVTPFSNPQPLLIQERCEILWYSRLVTLLLTLMGGGFSILVGRMGILEEELRDQVYLEASELRNYQESTASSRGEVRAGKAKEKQKKRGTKRERIGREEEQVVERRRETNGLGASTSSISHAGSQDVSADPAEITLQRTKKVEGEEEEMVVVLQKDGGVDVDVDL